ncbi:MAG TPA: LCP family protein [Aeromicrobium sp.]|nr:LCP family protein [Aeromicrobium sp.]
MSPTGPTSPGGYDWLYEDENAPKPPAGRSASGLPPPNLPPPNLPPPSGRGDGTPKRPKKRGRLRLFWLLLAIWLTFMVAVPVMAWSKVTKVGAEPEGERPAAGRTTTWLLVGTDKRPQDRSRGRTDTIILLTYGGGGPSVLTSIPRDSIVDIPGYGRTKINAAYAYGGPPLLVKTLESETGVRIGGYTEIGFGGVEQIVDALGGIEICPTQDIVDKDAKLNITKGCQEVDGKTALAYSRSRKAFATGDIARGQHQREVIGAIGAAGTTASTIFNPITYSRVLDATAKSLAVGQNDSIFSFGRFAWKLSRSMAGSGLNCTVPIADLSVRWDSKRALAYFGHLENGTTDQLGALCTEDGFAK